MRITDFIHKSNLMSFREGYSKVIVINELISNMQLVEHGGTFSINLTHVLSYVGAVL